jgi:hypothetical protein
MVMINNLLKHHTNPVELGEDAAASLANIEFHVAPLINPDGYEYTHTTDRMWRKNRRDNADGTMGVDLNRNWPNHWSESSESNQEDYQGKHGGSEPEVRAVSKYIQSNGPFISGIDYHSYGKMILRSPGWRRGKTKDEPMLQRLGAAMATATKRAGGGEYKSETAAQLYPCTGAMDDWMSENQKMWAHGWTVELPGDGHQFMLPEKDVRATAQGAFKGLVAFTQQIRSERRLAEQQSRAAAATTSQQDVLDLSSSSN